jgi:hypothetical protein
VKNNSPNQRPCPFPGSISIGQWSASANSRLTIFAQTKREMVAIYNRFAGELERKRDKQAEEEMCSEYFALITYDFPDKFSQVPASGLME